MLTKTLIAALAAATPILAIEKLAIGPSSKTTTSASTLANNLMTYLPSTGLLPQPYWWWESAGMFDTAIHYYHYSGDSQFNSQITAALLSQAGPNSDFMQPSATGNDDQLWWAIACMSAAEYNLPGGDWLKLATNVYNAVSSRWDSGMCNGGIGWQISPSADGYHYKNSISNGLAFQLAARLGRFTGNKKYLDFAEQIFDWTLSVGLIDKATHSVYDGTDALKGCIDVNHDKWSYNVGVFLYGAAVMSSVPNANTGKWTPHIEGFISAAQNDFAKDNILLEACEAKGNCNTDQLSFKAYLARWLAATAQMVPSVKGKIQPLLQASVQGALQSCNGSPGMNQCGSQWNIGKFDGLVGVGQQMAALEVTQGMLAGTAKLPGKSVARRFVA